MEKGRPENPMYPNKLRTPRDHIRARRLDLKPRKKDVAALIQGAMNPKVSLHFSDGNQPLGENIDPTEYPLLPGNHAVSRLLSCVLSEDDR